MFKKPGAAQPPFFANTTGRKKSSQKTNAASQVEATIKDSGVILHPPDPVFFGADLKVIVGLDGKVYKKL